MVFDARDKQCFDLNFKYLEWQCKEVYFKTLSHVLEFNVQMVCPLGFFSVHVSFKKFKINTWRY